MSLNKNGLKAQQAFSPTASEATPWVLDKTTYHRPVRAKAFYTLSAFALTGRWYVKRYKTQGVAIGLKACWPFRPRESKTTRQNTKITVRVPFQAVRERAKPLLLHQNLFATHDVESGMDTTPSCTTYRVNVTMHTTLFGIHIVCVCRVRKEDG